MRIAVLGTGGTGAYFGGLLARAGEDVIFIARGKHLEAIQEHGLTVKSRLVGDFTLPVSATSTTQTVGPVDLILFCVKAYDNATAIPLLPPLIGPNTLILSLQNGVENEDHIIQGIGQQPVLGAVSFVTSMVQAPGVIVQTGGPGKIVVGELDGRISSRVERLQAPFERAKIVVQLQHNIRSALWEKFLFICGFSGVTALTRLPLGPILATAETALFLQGVMKEVEAVARACGSAVSDTAVEQSMRMLTNWEPQAYGSLYIDLAHKHRLELEALNGAVVRLGSQHGVPTPLNFAISAALRPFLNGAPVFP